MAASPQKRIEPFSGRSSNHCASLPSDNHLYIAFEGSPRSLRFLAIGPPPRCSETPITDYRSAAPHLNSLRYATLARALDERGALLHASNVELWFVSTVQTEEDIDETLNALEDAVNVTANELRPS